MTDPGTATILHVSWARGYQSIAELMEDADVAVVGTVDRIAAEGWDVETPGVLMTRNVVRVEATLKGSSSPEIVVKQSGGGLGAMRQVVDDDPPMSVGQRSLLFLHRVTEGPYAGDYFVIGGPDGRFVVDDSGHLNPIGRVRLSPGTTLEGLLH